MIYYKIIILALVIMPNFYRWDGFSRQYLNLRFQTTEGSYYYKKLKWEPHRVAILIVDMWDRHHCIPSEKRVVPLAKKINGLLPYLRNQGVQVIFAPSDVEWVYADTFNRKRAVLLASKPKPFIKKLGWFKTGLPNEPPLPVTFGCEDEKQNLKDEKGEGVEVWTRQTDILKIEKEDLISSDGNEVVNILMNQKINFVLYAGVHSNVCILKNPVGMRNLKTEGFQVVLIRDLTDSLTKKSSQFPTQERRNQAVIDHINTYVAPTIHSNQLKHKF